jgi:CMP-N,N'-diacetyllegionaminic acid synthase
MKFIAVIPARAGSKSIKNKNLFQLNKKPLIQYTFEQLKKSFLKEKYLLSDDLNIKKLAKKFGICVDYNRPKNLSKGDTSLADTVSHFHKWLIGKKIYYDYLVILQPTSPLRSYQDINSAVQIVKKKKFKSLFSINESLEHPYESIRVNKNKIWKHTLSKAKFYYRRQDFDFKSFFINGAIYVSHRDLIIKKKINEKKNHGLLLMPKVRSIDVNDLEEAKIAESLIKNADPLSQRKFL